MLNSRSESSDTPLWLLHKVQPCNNQSHLWHK